MNSGPQPASVPSEAKEAQPPAVPGKDRPEAGTVLDLIPASRGDAVMSWVDGTEDGSLLVSIPQDPAGRPITLAAGEHIDVIWNASGTLRCLPVVLVGIDRGEPPRWRLGTAGVAQRGQRREAVRAPMRAPIILGTAASAPRGTTLDVSEGGLRCVLSNEPVRGSGAIASTSADSSFGVGDVVEVSVTLPGLTVTCLSEILRRHPGDDTRTELSLRFIGLPSDVQDGVRRRVFARLRDLRQRGLL